MASTVSSFTPGDLVVSLSGDGDGSGTYGDNQASPIVLEQINPLTGAIVPITGVTGGTLTPTGALVLPQTTVGANNAISGEYGSSSEGSLQLAANGQSLVIAGYGVNASQFNSAEAAGGPNTYGDAALAQTYSVPNGGTNGAPTGVTPVARVIADINANGDVDTSTALFNVFNTNNPRSVATTDGTSFYIAGQGVKGDATQGVFYAKDGAGSATPINTADDARTVELFDGNLYVSQDSKQPSSGGTSNISSFASPQPTTGPSAETPLPGISQTVTLGTANGNANGNGINGSSGTVHISPENFFFANPTTLYVADGGNPKQAGPGDGGLQKYSLANGKWNLDYTLSAGLDLVSDTTADPGQGGQATTGLIGLTGQVDAATGMVSLFATNATIGDLNQTYVYSISDSLAATTSSAVANESFTKLFTAPADTNVRGLAFAPQAAVCFASGTRIRIARGQESSQEIVDVAVEALCVGDLAVTASGERRPIRWIGHRVVDCRRHPTKHSVWPVRIAAHAFGESQPARDLVVSPGHAICVEAMGEVLIPAGALVDGAAIVQVAIDTVTYWHVELDSHDLLVAENLACESYLEMGNRAFFIESRAVSLAGAPDTSVRTHAEFCRPFYSGGPVVEAARTVLRRRPAPLVDALAARSAA